MADTLCADGLHWTVQNTLSGGQIRALNDEGCLPKEGCLSDEVCLRADLGSLANEAHLAVGLSCIDGRTMLTLRVAAWSVERGSSKSK